jgi:hypothetical protein
MSNIPTLSSKVERHRKVDRLFTLMSRNNCSNMSKTHMNNTTDERIDDLISLFESIECNDGKITQIFTTENK